MSRQLGRFLLPGPLAYCAKTDAFLTFNSLLELNCIKCRDIAEI